MTEKLPTVESSPTYPPESTFPHEPVIVTTPLLPPASLPPALNLQPPIVQKKLQKHAVVAGRALKIQVNKGFNFQNTLDFDLIHNN